MAFLKAATAIVTGLMTIVALRQMIVQLEAAKARVNSKPSDNPRPAQKLRQDPRTGIYYPEE